MSILSNCKEEVIIKILGKALLVDSNIDQLKLRDVIEDVLQNYVIQSAEKSLVKSDLEEKIMMYLAVRKLDGLSKNTLDNYQRKLFDLASYINKTVDAITAMDIRIYLANTSKDKKNSTIATEIWMIKSFFSWLESEEIIRKNPMKKVNVPKVEKRLRKSLTEEELEILRQNCTTLREKALLEFIFSTGCRVSEVININREDINWQDMSVKVIGKGNKERKVYFTIKAKLYLNQYLEDRKDCNLALFVSSKQPHGRLSTRAVEREIAKIADRAGFEKAVFPHLIRHTFATVALNNGIPLTAIQKLMGHESPATTQIYAELDDNTLKIEYKKLA